MVEITDDFKVYHCVAWLLHSYVNVRQIPPPPPTFYFTNNIDPHLQSQEPLGASFAPFLEDGSDELRYISGSMFYF